MPRSALDVETLLLPPAALHEAGRFDEALQQYQALAATAAHSPLYWNNFGNTLLELGRFQEACESYRQALAFDETLLDTRVALATCLQMLRCYDESRQQCEQVLERCPDHAEARWNRSLLLLMQGDYLQGWQEYEWRWRKRNFTSPRRTFSSPEWQREPLAGKRILVYGEQGFGDVIQFARYLPLLVDQGAVVTLECHGPLVTLMGSVRGITAVPFGSGESVSHDCNAPLLSLPRLLGAACSTIPAVLPYLQAPSRLQAFWSGALPRRCAGAMRVGLCWRGKNYPDPQRSCPESLLSPLGVVRGVEYISLQADRSGTPAGLPCLDLACLLDDFAETAAVIMQLDLVLTIDTVIAHLAGALGKETWVMLPYSPDWRWGATGDITPWYPQARLFRMEHQHDWCGVIATVSACLQQHADAVLRSGPKAENP